MLTKIVDVATDVKNEPVKEEKASTTNEKKVETSSTKEKITINETMPADFPLQNLHLEIQTHHCQKNQSSINA